MSPIYVHQEFNYSKFSLHRNDTNLNDRNLNDTDSDNISLINGGNSDEDNFLISYFNRISSNNISQVYQKPFINSYLDLYKAFFTFQNLNTTNLRLSTSNTSNSSSTNINNNLIEDENYTNNPRRLTFPLSYTFLFFFLNFFLYSLSNIFKDSHFYAFSFSAATSIIFIYMPVLIVKYLSYLIFVYTISVIYSLRTSDFDISEYFNLNLLILPFAMIFTYLDKISGFFSNSYPSLNMFSNYTTIPADNSGDSDGDSGDNNEDTNNGDHTNNINNINNTNKREGLVEEDDNKTSSLINRLRTISELSNNNMNYTDNLENLDNLEIDPNSPKDFEKSSEIVLISKISNVIYWGILITIISYSILWYQYQLRKIWGNRRNWISEVIISNVFSTIYVLGFYMIFRFKIIG